MEEEKIIQIDTLRLNYSRNKICNCYSYGNKPSYELDLKNRLVYCNKCNAIIEPFEALYQVASNLEKINEEISRAKAYKNELMSYKPYLRQAKRYEQMMREKDMLPVCPKCKEAFKWEDVCSMINKKFYKE